ncbi:MAG: hypothetical protein KDC87_10515, partial [Planctomycetes bacterium]|nr:hypothetical protein [Planctomycetota bacterium]
GVARTVTLRMQPLLVTPPFLVFPGTGIGSWTVLLPNDPAMVGPTFYLQVAVVDPSANNAGLTISNRVDVRAGPAW